MAAKRKRSTRRTSTARSSATSKAKQAQKAFAPQRPSAAAASAKAPFGAAPGFPSFAEAFSLAANNTEKFSKQFGSWGNAWANGSSAWGSPKKAGEAAARKGTDAMKDIISTSADEAQKVQEKVFSMGRESVEHLARSTDAAARSLNDAVAMSQENIEACVECGNIAAGITKSMSEELFNFANDIFSQNVELSKEVFACRTLNDMFELQSKIFKSNIDGVFNETAKVSEMMFHMASRAAEPISERLADATDRFTRSLAA